MAEIMKYTPTVGMTADQRNEAGYYVVIKAWVQEHIATFEKWFTVVYDDTGHEITLTPIAENISNRPLTLDVSGNSLYLEYPYSDTSTTSTYTDLQYDSPIHLYDSDDFFIGIGGSKFVYGIFGGKRFDDGVDVSVIYAMYSSYVYIYYKQASSYDGSIGSAYRRNAKLTDTYVIQRYIIEDSSIIMNNVFYLDSGMSLPPANDFKIGDTKYCKLSYNFVTKL